MSKRRSERLQVVLMIAEREERAAGVRLEQAQRQLLQQQQHLAQLKEYSRDYRQRIGSQRQGLRAAEIMAYRQFLQQLISAEDDQANVIVRMEQHLAMLKDQWREKYQRRKSVENLIERARQAETLEMDKRYQRDLDELAKRTTDDFRKKNF